MGSVPVGPWGRFEGRQVKGGDFKFSGTRGAERIVKDGEEVYLLVKAEAVATKFATDSHGDLRRQMFIRVDEMIECPDKLVPKVSAVINEVAEKRAAAENPPGMFDGEGNE